MLSSKFRVAVLILLYTPSITALGINCRGSGLCDRATLNNQASVGIIQLLRDIIYASSTSNNTAYASGDHVICLSQSQNITFDLGLEIDGISGGVELSANSPEGGICLFPQYLTAANLNLGQIKPLVDAILEHGCGTCGSVPVQFVDEGSNDPDEGILTFNYVESPYCVGECISDTGSLSSSAPSSAPSSSTTSSSSLTTFSSSTSDSVNAPTIVTQPPPVTVTEAAAFTTVTTSSKSTSSRLRGLDSRWALVIIILIFFLSPNI